MHPSIILSGLLAMGAILPARDYWTPEAATAWYARQPWMAGGNYLPRRAINQLEMWQAETFDPAMIDEELGWAQRLGLNTMRVFLHNMLWDQDREGFLRRMDTFLGIAERHGIRIMFVLLDGCWNPVSKLGPQPSPKPHTHNPGWLQVPDAATLADEAGHERNLKGYVTGVIGHFKADPRIVLWDIYNEFDNGADAYRTTNAKDKKRLSLVLARKAHAWALEADPTQPISSCIWDGCDLPLDQMNEIQRFQLQACDVVTFHAYTDLPATRRTVENLRHLGGGRPLLCSEYMARPRGSTFAAIMPYFKVEKIAAYHWGFIDGKSQTKYPWDSWDKTYTAEPALWFHDVLRGDGTPYLAEEEALIRSLTGAAGR